MMPYRFGDLNALEFPSHLEPRRLKGHAQHSSSAERETETCDDRDGCNLASHLHVGRHQETTRKGASEGEDYDRHSYISMSPISSVNLKWLPMDKCLASAGAPGIALCVHHTAYGMLYSELSVAIRVHSNDMYNEATKTSFYSSS